MKNSIQSINTKINYNTKNKINKNILLIFDIDQQTLPDLDRMHKIDFVKLGYNLSIRYNLSTELN